jgi:hypothetical protein
VAGFAAAVPGEADDGSTASAASVPPPTTASTTTEPMIHLRSLPEPEDREDPMARHAPGAYMTGSSSLQGKLIQRSVRCHT